MPTHNHVHNQPPDDTYHLRNSLCLARQQGYCSNQNNEHPFQEAQWHEKPVASIMCAGPTGTGKSYLSKLVSKNLDLKMITMDMTSYRSSTSMDRFLSDMTDNLPINPHAVYVFEEID